MSTRWLVVNADDFGFTCDVNRGIVEAHRRGILTSTTIMANGAAFDNAVQLARQTPTLDIGIHFVLVSGQSLLEPMRPLPATVGALLKAILTRRICVYDELRAQVTRILDAGLHPTHLDTHKHTHLFPPVLDAVARLGEEFQIPWVRRPIDFPFSGAAVPWKKRFISRSLGVVRHHFHRVLLRHGCRTTGSFAGFQITGRFRVPELVALIRQLPPGTTELMCHPGFCGPELMAARTRLKQSRQEELEALIAAQTRAELAQEGVRLVDYVRLPEN